MKYTDSPYTNIPTRDLYKVFKLLSKNTIGLYIVINDYSRLTNNCEVYINRIADELSISKSSVLHSTEELEKYGIITVERMHRRKNKYFLNDTDSWDWNKINQDLGVVHTTQNKNLGVVQATQISDLGVVDTTQNEILGVVLTSKTEKNNTPRNNNTSILNIKKDLTLNSSAEHLIPSGILNEDRASDCKNKSQSDSNVDIGLNISERKEPTLNVEDILLNDTVPNDSQQKKQEPVAHTPESFEIDLSWLDNTEPVKSVPVIKDGWEMFKDSLNYQFA